MQCRKSLLGIVPAFAKKLAINNGTAGKVFRPQLCWKHSVAAGRDDKRKWSYLHCASPAPLLGCTLGELVKSAAGQWHDQQAVVDVEQNVSYTYGELDDVTDKLACGFVELGLKRGDRLGIWGPNSYQWYLTFLAAAKAGLILVTLNPAYQAPEIRYCIDKVELKAVVIHDKFKTQDYYNILKSVAPELEYGQGDRLESRNVPSLVNVVSMAKEHKPGTTSFDQLLQGTGSVAAQEVEALRNKIQFDEACQIQFTSGTTGHPKAATLSHHGVVNNGYFIYRRMGYEMGKEKLCLPIPLFHCFANVTGAISGIHCGASLVFPSSEYSPPATLQSLNSEKCTVLYGTPTMHIDFINAATKAKNQYPSLKRIVSSGAICPVETRKQLKTVFGIDDMAVFYGLTETSPVSLHRRLEDSVEKQMATVGYPGEHVEVKLVDSHDNLVPIGKAGELCVRGYLTMLGYWGDPDKTREIIKEDRWLHTGDLFVMDEDGLCQIVGRLKDMLVRGGENIYPKEIEECLHTHPDIAEAYAFGVPDARLGEEVCTWIRLKDNASELTVDDIKEFCKGKIAHYKVPKYVHCTNDFPKTSSGKIQKFKMHDQSVSMFKLQIE